MDTTVDYYNKNANKFIEDSLNADMNNIYQIFLNNLPKNATILDVGCGSGRDSKFFLDNNYKVVAFDASKNLCDYASQLIKKEVICSTFEEFDSKLKFEGIWSCASFLHVNKENMLFIINKYLDLLSQNGVLYSSWKLGNLDKFVDGKYYCNLNEKWFMENKESFHGTIRKIWITNDVRSSFQNKWLNVLFKK